MKKPVMKNKSYADEIADACKNKSQHTPAPHMYLNWHRWAEEMSKTHRQKVCHGCGLFAIWVDKTAVGGEDQL